MPESAPLPVLACSLNATDAAERAARWRSLIDAELLARAATPAGQRLTFRSDPAVSAELDALVAAERDCCSFLTLTVQRSNEQLVLDAAAPAEAQPILDALLEAKP